MFFSAGVEYSKKKNSTFSFYQGAAIRKCI